MDPQDWREKGMQIDWDTRNRARQSGCLGCLMNLIWLGLIVFVIVLIFGSLGCSPKLQEKNLVKSGNQVSPLPQKILL